jgi:hypothetical protein
VRGGIWRGMQNGGPFRGPAGVDFLHSTSKFWSRGPYRGPHWSYSKIACIGGDLVVDFRYVVNRLSPHDRKKIETMLSPSFTSLAQNSSLEPSWISWLVNHPFPGSVRVDVVVVGVTTD